MNVNDKNFSETMFDMASIRKLKDLNLSFTPDLSLPGFSEALSKFTSLHSLRISGITNWGHRVNASIIQEFIAEGAKNLRSLSLDTISFTDDQFRQLLTAVSRSKSLKSLTLSSVHMDTDFKLEILTGFIGSNKNGLTKVTLVENQIMHLDTLLSMVNLNKTIKELHIMSQSYFRSESKLLETDVKAVQKENRTLEKLSLGLGVMKTIKPLIRCFCTFTNLREFSLVNIDLPSKLHFQVIDNYLLSN